MKKERNKSQFEILRYDVRVCVVLWLQLVLRKGRWLSAKKHLDLDLLYTKESGRA